MKHVFYITVLTVALLAISAVLLFGFYPARVTHDAVLVSASGRVLERAERGDVLILRADPAGCRVWAGIPEYVDCGAVVRWP